MLAALDLEGKNNRVPPPVAARRGCCRNAIFSRLYGDPGCNAVDMSAGAVPVGREAAALRAAGIAARYAPRDGVPKAAATDATAGQPVEMKD